MKKLRKLFSVIFAFVLILMSLPGLNVFAGENSLVVSGFNGDATHIEKGTSMKMTVSGVTEGKSVIWSVTGLDGAPTNLAQIQQTGALTCILTASADSYSTFKVIATQNDNSGKKGEQIISISGENLITVDDTDSSINYVNSGSGEVWQQNISDGYYHGTGKCVTPPEDDSYSSAAPAYAEFTFTGTGIQWISDSNFYCGVADVYLDGVKITTVDPFIAPSVISQFVNFSREGLPYGQHTIKIVATGRKNPASTQYPGTRVLVDAFRYLTEAAPTVDRSGLQGKITEAQALDGSNYTDETWANLQTALNAAIAKMSDLAATQEDIDSAKNSLQAAISQLVLKGPTVTLGANSTVQPGTSFTVAISLDNITQAVYAEDITMSFDPAVFEHETVTQAGENVNILGYTTPGGISVRIVAANIGGVTGSSTPIINVGFRVKNGVSSTSSDILVTKAQLGLSPEETLPNENMINAGLSSVTITVAAEAGTVDKDALRSAIEAAQGKLNSAVVGIENGCYWQSDKDTLQAAIASANIVYINSGASQSEVDNATAQLNGAVSLFEASVITQLTGDIDNSMTIDVADLAQAAYYFGAAAGDENWESAAYADINRDGKIDITDLAFIALRM